MWVYSKSFGVIRQQAEIKGQLLDVSTLLTLAILCSYLLLTRTSWEFQKAPY